MKNNVTNQAPATIAGVTLAIVQAVIGLVVAFGISVSKTESDAIVNVVTALAAALPLAGAAIDHARHVAKSNVTSAAVRAGITTVTPIPVIPSTATVVVNGETYQKVS